MAQSDEIDNENQYQIIHSLTFNWDNSCIALATSRGFKIFATEPLKLKQHRDLGAPLQLVQMVDRTNLLAFVGFQNTAFVAHRVAIFDDNSNNIIGDAAFESNILAVKIRCRKLVVALKDKIYLINFFTLEVQHVLLTYKYSESQRYNLISMNNDIDNFILAAPAQQNGHIILAFINQERQRKIFAHQSLLSAIVLTLNGDKVATSSEKGMNIRVFNTYNGQMIQQVRRGNQYGMIYCLSFSRAGDWLACSSDSCNIHVFAVTACQQQKEKKYSANTIQTYKNPKSFLYILRKILPYFDAQYSYCNYVMTEFEPEMQSFVGFCFHDDALLIINDYGNLKRININLPKSGRCKEVIQEHELLEIQLQKRQR